MKHNPLLVTTAQEYIETIRQIAFAQVSSPEEIRILEGQRGVLHEQLLSLLGMDRSSEEDMVKLAQVIVLEARAEGWTE
jgi:hypothetical protein